MKLKTLCVLAALCGALATPSALAEGHHGHDDSEPKDKGSEVAEFIFHHVSDDTEFEFEFPGLHLAPLEFSSWFAPLLIERTPGACDAAVSASMSAFPSLGKFMNGCWDLRPTKAILMMWIAMALLGLVLFIGRKRDHNGVPKGLASHVIESLVLFVRDEIAIPNIGKEEGPKYVPYLLTCFFFILSINYLGLVPGFFTGTAVLGVTAALALVTFVITQYAGIRSAGVVGYFGHLFGDVPLLLKPLMFVVEFLGLFTKPFALTVRLFANMVAGHMVIFFLLSLILTMGVAASVMSVPMAVGIYLLELFVSILQAYVFTLLTAIFIGQSVALGHHHGHEQHPSDHAH
jgi:F-type H+-transporting ATPase subunit a